MDLAGERLLARGVSNDQASIEALIAARVHGTPALVIDQPGSIAALVLAVARAQQVPVDAGAGDAPRGRLGEGEAKTDPRDSYVLADTARVHRRRLRWLDVTDDTLAELRVLSGYDDRPCRRRRPGHQPVARHPHRGQPAAGAGRRRPGWTIPRCAGAAGPPPQHPRRCATRAARIERLLKTKAPRSAARLAAQVIEAVTAQTVTVPGEAVLGRVIADLAGELDRLHTRRDALVTDMEALFLAHPLGPVLVTLPGVGPRTGAKILAEVGDGSRFASGSQLASYAGLAPVTRQSGSSVRGESRSRRGNHRLKTPCSSPPSARCARPTARPIPAQTSRRQTSQRRRGHLPGTPPLRCHPRHAHHRHPYQPRPQDAPGDLPAAA